MAVEDPRLLNINNNEVPPKNIKTCDELDL